MSADHVEPGLKELFNAIAACRPRAVSFRRVVMRSTAAGYANAQDLVSGEGAAAMGGRWNPRGIKAVYASLSPLTAVQEAYHNFLDFGFDPSAIRPRMFVGAEVELDMVLNLSDQAIRRRLGFTLAELLDEDWQTIQREGDESWTQATGRGAYEAGFEALLAPSSRHRPDGVNLVVFPDKLRSGSRIEIVGKDDLPGHPPPP